MKAVRLGFALAIGIAATFVAAAPGAEAQSGTILTAIISPDVVERDGTPVIESVDPCYISASTRIIHLTVTDPNGEVITDRLYTGSYTPENIDRDGNWSVELRVMDDPGHEGQPTSDPWPELGVYTVQVDCVSGYTPQVIKPYEEMTFEVVDQLPTPTTTVTPSQSSSVEPAVGTPAPSVPGNPGFTG